MRKDIHQKWGWPEEGWGEGGQKLRLADVMIDDSRRDELWIDETQNPIEWEDVNVADVQRSNMLKPAVVGKTCSRSGHVTSIFAGMVPATKASCYGVGGSTHLVADLKNGRWSARRLHRVEIERQFLSARVAKLKLHEDDAQAVSELGNSAPSGMVLPRADRVISFIRTPSTFVPQKMSDVVPPSSIEVCRGWMDLAATDFKVMAKLN